MAYAFFCMLAISHHFLVLKKTKGWYHFYVKSKIDTTQLIYKTETDIDNRLLLIRGKGWERGKIGGGVEISGWMNKQQGCYCLVQGTVLRIL